MAKGLRPQHFNQITPRLTRPTQKQSSEMGMVAGKEFLFADRGHTALKGFEEPVRLFQLHCAA